MVASWTSWQWVRRRQGCGRVSIPAASAACTQKQSFLPIATDFETAILPAQACDDITELAAQICECPVASVNMIDELRLWRKATYCHPSNSLNAPRDTTICATTVCRTDLLIVPDLMADERFSI